MKRYKLYVDETGTSHPKNHGPSPYYILVGCIVEDKQQDDLKIKADQIKFKYWGRTDIIFHSVDINKNLGDFAIFKNDSDKKEAFCKDLLELLSSAPLDLTLCLVEKKDAHQRRWGEKRVVKETAKSVIGDFIAYTYAHRPSIGKMVFEASNSFKDQEYLAAFNYFLSPNFMINDPDFKEMRKMLTSINFVTKQNHDIETQISDLFAYAARCMHQDRQKTGKFATGSYEKKLIKVLGSKLISTPKNIGAPKKIYYKKLKPFHVIPEPLSPPKEKSA